MVPAMLTARAPAKIIISGEHAVLYGQPAIAMAINRYTTTTTCWQDSPGVHFKLLDLDYSQTESLESLRVLIAKLQQEYQYYLSGARSIKQVLQHPFQLLQYTASLLLESLKMKPEHGIEVQVSSNIPIGSGMGSSAASIMSALLSLGKLLKLDWKTEEYLSLGKKIENLQHGKSSGLDLHLATYGGIVRFNSGVAQKISETSLPLQIINTGTPSSTTGECVTKVAQTLTNDQYLLDEFGAVTDSVQQALNQYNESSFKQAIRANHKLLQRIGVVPQKIGELIADIEAAGGAAKICGAGAICGDAVGVVLISPSENIEQIISKYGFNLENIQVDTHGTTSI